MRNKPLPVFFLCFECPLVGLLSLLLAPCPVLLPSSGAVRSSLPALLAVYHGVGRDGTRSLSRYRLPALPPLLARADVSPACVFLDVPACLSVGLWRCRLRSACLLACRHLCRYCGSGIVYMICPDIII